VRLTALFHVHNRATFHASCKNKLLLPYVTCIVMTSVKFKIQKNTWLSVKFLKKCIFHFKRILLLACMWKLQYELFLIMRWVKQATGSLTRHITNITWFGCFRVFLCLKIFLVTSGRLKTASKLIVVTVRKSSRQYKVVCIHMPAHGEIAKKVPSTRKRRHDKKRSNCLAIIISPNDFMDLLLCVVHQTIWTFFPSRTLP